MYDPTQPLTSIYVCNEPSYIYVVHCWPQTIKLYAIPNSQKACEKCGGVFSETQHCSDYVQILSIQHY